MRCKVGDLAVIVGAKPALAHHLGKVVKIVAESLQHPGHWYTEPELPGALALSVVWLDRHLSPIRDNDGPDESLAWAPRSEHLTDIIEHAKEQQ